MITQRQAKDDPRPVKIWRMNDYEWWAGFELEETISHACEETGIEREDLLFHDGAEELSAEDMDHLMFTEENSMKKTFKNKLIEIIAEGEAFPCMFAGTEN